MQGARHRHSIGSRIGARNPLARSRNAPRTRRNCVGRILEHYAMKDTYVSTALTVGVNTAWLEAQTGVRYETLKRHYGKWLRSEGADQLEKMAHLAPNLAPTSGDVQENREVKWCERGDLNPHGFYPTGS